MNDKALNVLEKYIEDNKMTIPSLEGKTFEEIMSKIVSDEALFSQLLCLLSVLVNGRYITLSGEIAKASVKYKIEKKAFLLNIVLDILFYLEFIVYEKVTEEKILIRIANEDMANELNTMKIKLREKGGEFKDIIDEVDNSLAKDEKYQEIKRDLQ